METCPRCDGFLPPAAPRCPHCEAGRPATFLERGSGLRRALEIAGGGAIALTLMACYGAPPRHYPAAEPDPRGAGDCQGAEDLDGDGWCQADCDEVDPQIFPGAPDPVGDGLDQNCDGGDGESSAAPVDQTIAR